MLLQEILDLWCLGGGKSPFNFFLVWDPSSCKKGVRIRVNPNPNTTPQGERESGIGWCSSCGDPGLPHLALFSPGDFPGRAAILYYTTPQGNSKNGAGWCSASWILRLPLAGLFFPWGFLGGLLH